MSERPAACGCNDTNTPLCAVCRRAGVTAPPKTVPPCLYRGERQRVNSNREWVACTHPTQPLGPLVCSCKGCGPKCKGYEPNPVE